MDASSEAPSHRATPGPGSPFNYLPGATSNPAPPAWSLAGLSRIGVYGGSFDPVHRGHLHVAAAAQAARGLERVVFIPAAQPPHKAAQRLASGADRLAMLGLALRGHPDWLVDDLELQRGGPSFTIDTLREVRARWQLSEQARLFLVLGSDNLAGFAQWREVGELLERSEPVVVARERDLGPALRELGARSPSLAARLERALLDLAPVEVSSSEIRSACERGNPPAEDLPAGVAEYIRARGIYVARSSGAPLP